MSNFESHLRITTKWENGRARPKGKLPQTKCSLALGSAMEVATERLAKSKIE